MIQAAPTKHGTGLQLWGDYDDLKSLYHTTHKLTENTEWTEDAAGSRCRILHGFAYSVRHAYQGNLLKNKVYFKEGIESTYLGFNYSWIDVIYTISSMRHNASFSTLDQLDQTNIACLEYWTKKALHEYDSKGAVEIENHIGIYGVPVNDELTWHYNQQTEIDFQEMKHGVARFRKIPYLLSQAFTYSPTYSYFKSKIENTAKELNCKLWEIEYMEFPKIKW